MLVICFFVNTILKKKLNKSTPRRLMFGSLYLNHETSLVHDSGIIDDVYIKCCQGYSCVSDLLNFYILSTEKITFSFYLYKSSIFYRCLCNYLCESDYLKLRDDRRMDILFFLLRWWGVRMCESVYVMVCRKCTSPT